MNSKIQEKKILIIGRDYFFYTQEIARELEGFFGSKVTFYPIEPSSLRYRMLKKNNRSGGLLAKYHQQIIEKEKGTPYDVVFFIQVHQIGDIIQSYKSIFSDSYFLLYYWDSVKTHDYVSYLPFFDGVYTFDKSDSNKYEALKYLPLFYAESFRKLRNDAKRKYDVSFVGTIYNLQRYEQLQKYRKWARERDLVFYDYSVISVFTYFKMFLKGLRPKKIHFLSLSRKKLEAIYGLSSVVLDLPNNIQSGYTMRVFETLGAHRKLATTNLNIVNEDFYASDNIYLLGEKSGYPDNSFIKTPFMDAGKLEAYSLQKWLLNLFSDINPAFSHITSEKTNKKNIV